MGKIELRAGRIAGFALVSQNAGRLAAFFESAFGAVRVLGEHGSAERWEQQARARGEPKMTAADGAVITVRHTLRVGHETLDILQFDAPGRSYPRSLPPWDPVFQHFALVVSDMDLAMAQLRGAAGWTAISTGGPQRLPRSSGGVTAFKFRDPDGHPLELLAFAEHAVPLHWKQRSAGGVFLGIDHSAISVRDTAVSTAFYESLGFSVAARSLNEGVEQANLDGVPSPQVEVTALSLQLSTPHLELLCYRSEDHPVSEMTSSNDVAATRIVLAAATPVMGAATAGAGRGTVVGAGAPRLVIDPDGHRLLLVP